MYNVKYYPGERYLVITIEDRLTEEEYREYEQKLIDFSVLINFRRYAVVSDARSNPYISDLKEETVNIAGDIVRQLGLVCIARVFDPKNSSNVETMRKNVVKMGYIANYFSDMESAVNFAKKTLASLPDVPVITYEEARKLVNEKYSSYGYKI